MFTLIAYRSNGYCSSGSQTNSDLEISYHDTTESLGIEFLKFKKKEFENRDCREYDNYEFTILQDGRDIMDINYSLYQDIFDELNSVANADKVKWKQEEEDKAALKRLQIRNDQRARDLAELARIQERLGIVG